MEEDNPLYGYWLVHTLSIIKQCATSIGVTHRQQPFLQSKMTEQTTWKEILATFQWRAGIYCGSLHHFATKPIIQIKAVCYTSEVYSGRRAQRTHSRSCLPFKKHTYMFSTVNTQSTMFSQLFWRIFKIYESPTYCEAGTLCSFPSSF